MFWLVICTFLNNDRSHTTGNIQVSFGSVFTNLWHLEVNIHVFCKNWGNSQLYDGDLHLLKSSWLWRTVCPALPLPTRDLVFCAWLLSLFSFPSSFNRAASCLTFSRTWIPWSCPSRSMYWKSLSVWMVYMLSRHDLTTRSEPALTR